MKRRKWKALLLAGALAAGSLLSACGFAAPGAKAQGETQPALYHGPWAEAQADTVCFEARPPEGQSWAIEAGESLQLTLSAPAAGEYYLLLSYRTGQDVMLRSVLRVELAGQECLTQLYSVWRDATKDYGEDRLGNQLSPTQVTLDEPVSDYVTDQTRISRRPFAFSLPAGESVLTLTSDGTPLLLEGAQLVAAGQLPDYEQYSQDLAGAAPGRDVIVIEGEDYSTKSDSSIRSGSMRMAALTPYDYSRRLLNVLDGASYATAGQKVQYAFTVEQAGVYNIAFHYQQNTKEDIPVYQNIRIDGQSLFAEMESVAFPYTGVEFDVLPLTAQGQTAGIWLDAGEHTLLLEADGAPVQQPVSRLEAVMEELSGIGLEIKKLAGTQADANRTWDVESYLPGVLDRLAACEQELWLAYDELGALQKEDPAGALGIKQAANNLAKVLEEPDKIPGKLSLLSEGSGSATQLLADQIDKLNSQGLTLDAIYIQSGPFEQQANAGLFTRAADGIKRFFHALFLDEGQDSEEVLEVWVNRPIQYMQVMQTMADTQFTPETGIRVRFSTMPSEQRIVLSNATDMAPDVVMGLATNTPFDLGLRGAVSDLTQFDGFAELMEQYNAESLTPYILGDQVFGATETQDFYVLIYRTDILEQLGLEIPRTWDDVRDMMPVLQRNSMNFYLQLSGYTGTKPLYSTAPFLMQAGGGIYSETEGAAATGVNSAASLEGFTILTDLYRLYSVQPTVSSFYNSFRYGQIPLGIGSFSDYVRIKNAAPEIADKWAVAPAPGVEDENGVIHNGTTGASSACAIMAGSDKQQESWRFRSAS